MTTARDPAAPILSRLPTLAQRAYRRARTWVYRYRHWQFERNLARVAEAIVRRQGQRIVTGPFAGMEYSREAVGSPLPAKLVGCYEEELHGLVERIVTSAYDTIINVGCAEGYYAVGLARRMPATRVIACDIDPRARRLCAEVAARNGVGDRVQVEGACTPERLAAILAAPATGRALAILDCEGYELQLLQPEVVPGLRDCAVLVELHDFVDNRISATIRERCEGTHAIEIIDGRARDPDAYPAIACLSPEDRRTAVNEFRPEVMQWAFMVPHPASAS